MIIGRKSTDLINDRYRGRESDYDTFFFLYIIMFTCKGLRHEDCKLYKFLFFFLCVKKISFYILTTKKRM